MSDLTGAEIDVIVESLRSSKRAVGDAPSPPEYKQKKMEMIESILSKLSEIKKNNLRQG
jgi:hypothetical protein